MNPDNGALRDAGEPGSAAAVAVADAISASSETAAELTIVDLLDEIIAWARTSRPAAWRKPVNYKSLELEIESTVESVGGQLLSRIQPALDAFSSAFSSATKADSNDNERLLVANAAEDLQSILGSRDAIRAAFQDVITGTSNGSAELPQHARNFRRLVANDKSEQRLEISSIAGVLRGDPFQTHLMRADLETIDADTDDPSLSSSERFALVERSLGQTLAVGHCIAWLTYQPGFVPSFELEAGPVTFLAANWYIPNARNDDGQLFPLRDELRKILGYSLFADIDTDDPNAYVLLARVDLGVRSMRGAIDDAESLVSIFQDLAVNASGGVRWSRFGESVMVFDGEPRLTSMVAGDGPPPIVDTHGMGITAKALGKKAPDLGAALARGPMPIHLREAIKLQTEAQLTSARAYLFMRNKAISDRTVVALQDRASESIATHSGVQPQALAVWAADRWAYGAWHRDVFHCVNLALSSPDADYETRQAVESKVNSVRDGIRGLDLEKAVEHQEALLALLSQGPTRERTAMLLGSVRDASVYLSIRSSYRRAVTLLQSRARRARNAVVHGNPLTPNVLDSIKEYTSFVCDSSISLGLRSYIEGVATADLIGEYEREASDQMVRFAKGENWLQIWESYR